MPVVIAEDEQTVTYLTDDGREVRVPKETAERLGVFRPGDMPLETPADIYGHMAPTAQTFAEAELSPERKAEMGLVPLTPGEHVFRPGEASLRDTGLINPEDAKGRMQYGMAPRYAQASPVAAWNESEPEAKPTQRKAQYVAEAPAPKPTEHEQARVVRPDYVPRDLAPRDAMETYAAASDRMALAMREKQAVEQEEARQIAEANARKNEMTAAHEQRIAEVQQKAQAEIEEGKTSLDAAVQRALKMKPDRGRFWASRSTGQKIAAGLGMVLGAVGQAMSGRRNEAQALILKAIDDDVKLQLEEIEKAKGDVSLLRENLADIVKVAQSRVGLEEALGALAIGAVMRDIEQIGLETADEKIKVNTDIELAELGREYAGKLHAYATGERAFGLQVAQLEEQKRHAKRMEGIAGYNATTGRINAMRQKDALEWQKRVDMAKLRAEAAEETGVLLNPENGTTIGKTRFPKKLYEDQQAVEAYRDFRSQLSRYHAYLNSIGREFKTEHDWISSTEYQTAIMMARDLAWTYTKATQGSRPSDKDIEMAIKMFGDGARGLWQNWDPGALLKEWKLKGDQGHTAFLIGRGVEPSAARQYTASFKGMDIINEAQRSEQSSADQFTKLAGEGIPEEETTSQLIGRGMLGVGMSGRLGRATQAMKVHAGVDAAFNRVWGEGDASTAAALVSQLERGGPVALIIRDKLAEYGAGDAAIAEKSLRQIAEKNATAD